MNVLRKLSIFMIIFMVCLGFAACSAKEKESSNDLRYDEQQESQAPESQAPEVQEHDEKATVDPNGTPQLLPPYSYEIEARNWDVDGITVKYPMIVNMGMLESGLEKKADKVNDLIMNDMENLIETIQSNIEGKVTIDGSFEYSQLTPEVLSIRYEIDYSSESLAYPVSLYHTLTISLDQDAVIPLSDLFVINESFVEDFKTWWIYAPFRDLDLEASGVKIQEAIEMQYSSEDLLKLFSQEDCQYYLTDQGLFISIEVPHALGDHLEKAMQYEYLEVYIKKDHPLWADYMFLGGDPFEGTNEGEMYNIEKTIKVGDIYTIKLNENLSTGYSWQYVIEDDVVIGFESDNVLENGDTSDGVSEVVGTGSQHEWNFQGLSKGTTVISFDYMRSWEDRGTEAQTLTYVITVE